MFKKKPQIKTLSPLRSSDRRKLADKIIADYGLDSKKDADSTADDQAAVAAHASLRKALLPDNALSAKFTTTTGPDLKEVAGTVYVGSHAGNDQRVLWVKIEEVVYPTVYSLWHNPRLLPLLHTPRIVIDKLKGGADLMTPGLAGPPFPKGAGRGSLVAIASLESASVPQVVGTCLIDVSALQSTQGVKGHAVETFHWAGDELWDWSTSGRSGTAPPQDLPKWLEDPADDLVGATESLAVDDEDEAPGGVSIVEPPDGNDGGGNDLAETVDMASSITPKEIDDAFWKAFLYGVHQQMQTHRNEPKYGIDFPVGQSKLMATYVQPFLPIHSPEQAQVLQMKKTTWKNAKKFIKALDKAGIVLSKEGKNESSVLDIDFQDAQITGFQPYRLPKKETAAATEASPANEGADDSVGQTLKVSNLYKPKDSLLPLFKDVPKSSYHTAAEIKKAVADYAQSQDLIEPANKRMVKLNPVISNAVLSEDSKVDRDALAKGSIPREALADRVIEQCALSHVILRNGETIESTKTKPKPGAAPKIGILVETRGGNKTATRVYGLEPFFVKSQPLADELRKACAGSTSVEPFKQGKGMEVMVQGPQIDAVYKALARRGVNRAWVEVTDKTKGKKK